MTASGKFVLPGWCRGEELKRDEFDVVLDRMLASAAPLTIE